MRLRLVLIISAAVLVPGVGTATLVAHAANASGGPEPRHGPGAQQFVGYWMGIGPLDGGDSRRGITTNNDGTFSVIGRDTVFTLCDGACGWRLRPRHSTDRNHGSIAGPSDPEEIASGRRSIPARATGWSRRAPLRPSGRK